MSDRRDGIEWPGDGHGRAAWADRAANGDRRQAGRRWQAVLNDARAAFAHEMEAGRGFLWLPVLLGIGIILYFALPDEPSLVAVTGLAAGLSGAAWLLRVHRGGFRLCVAAATIAVGAAGMKLRTDAMTRPVLPEAMVTDVTGWVAARESASRGGVRILLRVADIERLDEEATPPAVRVTVRSGTDLLAVGAAVKLTASLQPPGGAVMPGGFDFARTAFYRGLGAVGFAYGAPVVADLGEAPLDIRLVAPLSRLRDTIRRRILEALPGVDGHLAVALIIGDRGGIPDDIQEVMRASGLGHVLAISGLHMALVAGSVFAMVRAILALSPTLALTRPIKKWAAVTSLLVGAAYLAISGSAIATQRAFIMLAVMMLAVVIDRRAITLRNVAIAALIVLALQPESVLSASFQMSFAATLALVAGYEAVNARSRRHAVLSDRRTGAVGGWVWRAAAGVFLTSLIAGLATTPFAVFHFQRMAPLGLIANLAAMPVFALMVMPMALLAVVLMPLGLAALPLMVMSWGIDWVLFVAATAVHWSAGLGGIRMVPLAALLVFVSGFLWLCLWRERWRLAGLVPMALALPLATLSTPPVMLVGEAGETVAVRGVDGRYRIIGGRGHRFVIDNWLRADGDPRTAAAEDLGSGVACDELGCVTRLEGVGIVAWSRRVAATAEDCRVAAVVITRFTAPRGCTRPMVVVDRARLDAGGALALYRSPDKRDDPPLVVETAYSERRRPFMPGGATGQ